MAPSEEEMKPSGFTLNLCKYNNVRSTNRRSHTATANRYTDKKQKKRHYSSMKNNTSSSLSFTRRIRNVDTSGSSSLGSTISKAAITNSKKKRTRKEVLASISANARKMTIPIPSFKMIDHKINESKLKLSRLERAFFDEESDDSSDNSSVDEVKLVFTKINTKSTENNMTSSLKKVKEINPKDNQSVMLEVDDSETETDGSDDEILSISKLRESRRQEQSKPSTTVQNIADVPKPNKPQEKCNGSKHVNVPLSIDRNESTDKPKRANVIVNHENNLEDDNNEDKTEIDSNCAHFQNVDAVDGSDIYNNKVDAKLLVTDKNELEYSRNSVQQVLVPVPSAFDLDREIDLLFLNSDTNTITVNTFYKELENQVGKALDKLTRKKVRTRLVSLINGQVKPGNGVCAKINEVDNIDEKNDFGTSHTKIEEKDTSSNCQKKVDDEKYASNKSKKKKVEIKTSCQTKGVNEKSGSKKLSAENKGNELTATSQNSTHKKEGRSDRSQGTQKSNNPLKQKIRKPNTKDQAKEDANPGSGRKESNAQASRGNKSKENKPEVLDKEKNCTTKKALTTAIAAIRPRKRARSKLCAFCKTCSCQKTDGNDTIPIFDMNKFSRTNAAKEKALMRRLQNLEKKTENLEEQTEVARRQLKKHRRDIWKRKERDDDNPSSSMFGEGVPIDDYFLPDAEIFEKQQTESQALPDGLWEKAQIKVFHKVPTYQPTLTQLMGFSNNSEKNIGNISGEVADPSKDVDRDDGDGDTIENKYKAQDLLYDDEDEDDEDDTVQTEYVMEREYVEQIQRFERNGGIRGKNDKIMATSGSIWDTVLPLTQKEHDGIATGNMSEANSLSRSRYPWDELFEGFKDKDAKALSDELSISVDRDPEAGLDDLLDLFENGAENPVDDYCTSQSIGDKNPVEMSLLSQDAQAVARQMISSFSSASEAALQRSCPNWKENIYFALLQKDPNEIQEALENVRHSKMRMRVAKQKILVAWESKNVTLEVFESALIKSAARLNSDSSTSGHEDDAEVLTQVE